MSDTTEKKKPQPPKQPEPSFWGKVDILMKPIGGLATAAVVAYIGYLSSNILQDRQQTNAKVQLYAQIMSSREEAETGLRREMFNSIIQTFLREQPGTPARPPRLELEQRLLALQLLTYNFHDALDLGPLFKYLEQQAIRVYANDTNAETQESETDAEARERKSNGLKTTLGKLKRTARDVITKQIAVLESDGATKSEDFILSYSKRGVPNINQVFPEAREEPKQSAFWFFDADQADDAEQEYTKLPPKHFRVEMIAWDFDNEEVKVRLKVLDPETKELEIDETFWVGSFDFPLIDNTRLSGGGRCAVVLEKFYPYEPPEKIKENEIEEELYGEVTLGLIYFPGSRASLKSRPYYDEVIRQTIGHTYAQP